SEVTKWVPYNKGGSFRKWYGNYDYVVNWNNNGYEIKNFKNHKGKQRSVIRNPKFYFNESITWSDVTSVQFSMRYRDSGSIHDVTGMSAFANNKLELNRLLGLMNTKVANYVFSILNPTLHLQIGDFSNFPVIRSTDREQSILELVEKSINISKMDWDSY